MNRKILAAGAALLLLAGWMTMGTVQADEPPGPGGGWGMMGGGNYGMGPGMMGGYGPGYGQGMMWGDGDGHRPYGGRGNGYGPGMMGGMMGPWWALDLNDKQRAAIMSIMDEQHKTNWPLMGRLYEEQSKLNELYRADKLDSDAITKASDRIFKVQREMIEANIKTRNRIMEQLTPEQREQLKRYRWRYQD